MCRKCYPLAKEVFGQEEIQKAPQDLKWRIVDRISENFYILCRRQDSQVRYSLLFLHSFAPGVHTFLRQNRRYDELPAVRDRLRWCRCNRGLTQTEVARRTGISINTYKNLEKGITRNTPEEIARKLAQLYEVPATDFMDEFDRFLCDGQARSIRSYREHMGMSQRAFSQHTGIPLSSLRSWESGKKIISRQSWERYFGRRA